MSDAKSYEVIPQLTAPGNHSAHRRHKHRRDEVTAYTSDPMADRRSLNRSRSNLAHLLHPGNAKIRCAETSLLEAAGATNLSRAERLPVNGQNARR